MVLSFQTSRSRGNVGKYRSRSRSRLRLKIKCLGLVSVSYHRVSFTSQYALLFASSLQNCTYIVLNARRLYCLVIHQFTYLLQYKCMSDHDIIPATTLRTKLQVQQPPSSDTDTDLLSSNAPSGGPIPPAMPANSKKLKLFDFMSTQPQCREASKNYAMFNPHTKFEMSTNTCNEEMKGNTKCKNLVLSHPLGDLGVTYRVHLWLDGKRIVDLLLAIMELFSLALTAVAQLSEICRNWRFLKG